MSQVSKRMSSRSTSLAHGSSWSPSRSNGSRKGASCATRCFPPRSTRTVRRCIDCGCSYTLAPRDGSTWSFPPKRHWCVFVATVWRSPRSRRRKACQSRFRRRDRPRGSAHLPSTTARGTLPSSFWRIRTLLPVISFPCLSFTWELVAPSSYEAVDCGAGIVAVDGEQSVDWALGGLDLWRRGWDLVRRAKPPG